ncbi:MAG: bifunctional acetaldehyde-CoA/alcohol dehydrogenase [Clostridia bacterium]|nr:bifunctional acetaldehyde-CoA/alcohol dehydrogenase [Clostridia bacterium]
MAETKVRRKPNDSPQSLREALERLKKGQKDFSAYSQEAVDKIFEAAAIAANRNRVELAELAVQETGMGAAEDKVIKNHYACEYVYNAYRNTKTCGKVSEDKAAGISVIAEPVGVVGAVIPTTNPTSTTIFKILLALKTRNAIIISPHPRASKCTARTAELMLKAAVEAGAPENIIDWIDKPSLELTDIIMKETDFILATGGPAMVKAAYSGGKPAIGVGAGNTPAVFDESCDILMAVSSVIHSKTFDNGVICASEQAVIVSDTIYSEVKKEFARRGGYFLRNEETDKIRELMMKDGKLNAEIVGKTAIEIAKMADIDITHDAKVLIGEVESTHPSEPFACEKLSPVLAMYKSKNFEESCLMAETLIEHGGYGHTAAIYIDSQKEKEKLDIFYHRMKSCRIIVNSPASQGAVGDLYNFRLAPSLTLGCGSWGGNSVCENVGVKHLLNYKTVAERRENMLWFRTPPKVYFKRGCLEFALEELVTEMGKKRVFIVTDEFLFKNGNIKPVTEKLNKMGVVNTVFYNVRPDPTLENARDGAESMRSFQPDTIIAFGGGSAMDAAKIMWLMYEHPEADFEDMSMRFMDIRKRIYKFPEMGQKAYFVAIPTSAGTGSEVTPFAVITDNKNGIKYPIADYALMPDMAIVDVDCQMEAPKGLTAAAGIDAVTHAIEAYVSVAANDYTDALALSSLKLAFKYLPEAYEKGNDSPQAREKIANAATMAGMAFANAFLGICHSMAHKLGSQFSFPHGISNALLICPVIRFNSSEKPYKMGTFPQYSYPCAATRYGEIADALGLGGETEEQKVENLINAVEDLKKRLGIKPTIAEYGISEREFKDKLHQISVMAFDDQCTVANPRYPLIEEIEQLYLEAYYGFEKKGS